MTSRDPIWVSATQIDKFRTCPRLWAWDKLERVPRGPEKGAAKVGTRVHTIAEDWLLKRTPPDLTEEMSYPREDPFAKPGDPPVVRHPGRIFHAGMHLLPVLPPERVEVECEFKIPITASRGAPAILIGKVDLRYPDGDGFVTLDHKTTSSLADYLKPVEVLSKDVQALIYAAAESVRTGPGPKRMRWIYYQTKPSKIGNYKAQPVDLVIDTSTPEVMSALDGIEETIQNMSDARELYRAGRLKVLDLPPVPQACDKYLGCPHRERCNLTPEETLKGAFSEMTQNMDPQIAALLGGIAGPQPVGAPAAPPAPPAPPAPAAPHDARAAAIADGWQPHPQAPDRAGYKGQESLAWSAIEALYPPPPAPPAPTVPEIPPPPPVPDVPPAPPAVPPTPASPPPAPAPSGERPHLSPERAPEALNLYAQGMDESEISIRLGVSLSSVQAAIRNLQINAPEAPRYDAPPPVLPEKEIEAPTGDRGSWGRDEWKQQAMSLGLVDSSSRHGEATLRKLVEEHEAKSSTPAAPAAPVDHPHAEILAALTRIRRDLTIVERAAEALAR